jgi:hypothetical protein
MTGAPESRHSPTRCMLCDEIGWRNQDDHLCGLKGHESIAQALADKTVSQGRPGLPSHMVLRSTDTRLNADLALARQSIPNITFKVNIMPF